MCKGGNQGGKETNGSASKKCEATFNDIVERKKKKKQPQKKKNINDTQKPTKTKETPETWDSLNGKS